MASGPRSFGLPRPAPPPPKAAPSAAGQPPLFKALLGSSSAHAIKLLKGGADAQEVLPGGLTALHAAALGSAADAVPALVAAGVPVDAQLAEPLQLPNPGSQQYISETAPAGSTALTLASAMGQPGTVEALLAAGAAYELPKLRVISSRDLFAGGVASPWHWAAKRPRASQQSDAAAAVRAMLLADARKRLAAGPLALQPEQLMGLLVAAALEPAGTDDFAALAALPGAAEMLDEGQRRGLAEMVVELVEHGDAEAVHALQAGPLRQQPLDPDGSMLEVLASRREADALPTARALLQYGTLITLTAINEVIRERVNAPLLELMLSSGLPLPRVPLGSTSKSVDIWGGEYDTPDEFHDVTCPFYTLFRRDCHYLMKTPQELRVRMCQALLRAGYRPTVYNSITLQVLNKSGTSYTPKALPNFHILCDWGRLGLSATSTERICCFPGAHPKQDKLLTGDNRLLWMLVEGEPWSPADHRYWPPAFKAAARTLLLAHRRGAPVKRRSGSPTRGAAVERQANPLSRMPLGFIMAVIAAAAFPLEAWFDDDSRQNWLASEFWRQINWGF